MKKSLLVVVDADAIVALAHPLDANHKKSGEISRKLVKLKAQVIYPVTAITEAVTVIQRVLGSKETAYQIALSFAQPEVNLVEIDHQIYSNAVDKYFVPDTSKKNTLFDCIVASVAERFKAEAIFSFDNFYKKQGFKLASEL